MRDLHEILRVDITIVKLIDKAFIYFTKYKKIKGLLRFHRKKAS